MHYDSFGSVESGTHSMMNCGEGWQQDSFMVPHMADGAYKGIVQVL